MSKQKVLGALKEQGGCGVGEADSRSMVVQTE